MKSLHTYKIKIQAYTLLLWVYTTVPFWGIAQHTNHLNTTNFIENKGQTASEAFFYTQQAYAHLYIEQHAFQYLFFNSTDVDRALQHPRSFDEDLSPKKIAGHALRMSFLNANKKSTVQGAHKASYHFNFFTGNDKSRWASECGVFGEVKLNQVYEGVDVLVYGQANGNMKYDLHLSPAAQPQLIKMNYEGAVNIKLVKGALHIKTTQGTWIENKPIAYQLINGSKKTITCSYELLDNNTVGFKLGEYNNNEPLVIDPELIFSTYSGSTSNNFGATATFDNNGNLYAAGITSGPLSGYPATAGAFDLTFNGGLGSWPQNSFSCDITISKYNSDGTALIYATYLGGNRNEYVHSLVVNNRNELIVLGTTLSKNFPVTTGAFDTTHNDSFDIIVVKFSSNGSHLRGSTYIGGTGVDGISVSDTLRVNYMDQMRGEIQVSDAGDVYVGSVSSSFNFPVTSGVMQNTHGGAQDGVVFKLDSTLSNLTWSTYLGMSRHETLNSIELANDGSVYVAGGTHSTNFSIKGNVVDSTYKGGLSDAWIGRISKHGDSLLQFMYWGSSDYDQAYFIRTDRQGNVYVLGQNFDSVPVTSGTYRNTGGTLFISSFTATFDSLRFSTRVGNGIAKNILAPSAFMVDICGSIYTSVWGGTLNVSSLYQTGGWRMGGVSTSTGLPLTANALQPFSDGNDFYLFVLDSRADSLLYATYYGENGEDDHVDGGTSRFDSRGIVYQSVCASCGTGSFGQFPTTNDAFSPQNRSTRCSNASLKIDFRVSNLVTADFKINPRVRCTDSLIVFTNNSYNANTYRWFVNGIFADTTTDLSRIFNTPGTYRIKLIAIDSLRCNIADSIEKEIRIGTSVNGNFTVIRDTCSARWLFKNLTTTSTGDSIPVLWDFGDGNTSTLQSPYHEYAVSDAYPVFLYLLDPAGCGDTVFQYVNYDRNAHILTAALSAIDSITCEPARVEIYSFGRGGQLFKWFLNDSLVSTDRNLDIVLNKGRYFIRHLVTDSSTCKIFDSAFSYIHILPEVVPAFSARRDSCSYTLQFNNESIKLPEDTVPFIWYFGDGDSSTQINPKHTYAGPGQYIVQLNVNKGLWCEYTATDTIFLDNNNLLLKADFDIIPNPACENDIIQFTNTSNNGIRYHWYLDDVLMDSTREVQRSFQQQTTHRMKLIVFDTATCFKEDSIEKTFSVFYRDTALFTYYRDTCSPHVIFTNLTDTNRHSGFTFRWDFGDGSFSTDYQPTPHVYASSGNYTVRLTVNPGSPCADSFDVNIAYDSSAHMLSASYEINDTDFCLPASIVTTNTSFNNTYNQWFINGQLVSNDVNFDTILTQPGTYVLRLHVTDSATCKVIDTVSKQLVVSLSAVSGFELIRDSCSLETKWVNTSQTTPGTNTTCFWDFGDGDTSTLFEPEHTYKSSGLYTVKLYTNLGSVCADTTEKTYLIDGDTSTQLFIPNVFTPNNDGTNDCFTVSGIYQKCDEFEIWIRNRWGNLFYHSIDANLCWDGKNEIGEDAAPGTYYYIIRVKKKQGKTYDLNGTVLLMR